jgi:hypothetical protein
MAKYMKMEDVGVFLKKQYQLKKMTEEQVKFAVEVAQGATPVEAYRNNYMVDNMDIISIRSAARSLVNKPHMQDLIRLTKQHFKSDMIVDLNTIMYRMEELYQASVDDQNNMMQLMVLKEMAKIITSMKGDITVTNSIVQFKLPSQQITVEKQITTSDGEVKTITNIAKPDEISRMLKQAAEEDYNDE